ncbi:MAG TPA: M17 family peptidase N-terminal domain-containing protein, partial [Jatrophihabitantaceae bacterium]|nr:M17 family peptidase N-terminal domain-containing protein [Jatrophihabitantaceae bacterium]
MASPTLALADRTTSLRADAVVVATTSGTGTVRLAPGAADVDKALGGRLSAALAALDAKGTAGEVLRIPTLGEAEFPLVVATGVGANPRDAEALRRATGAALRTLTGKRTVHIAIDGPTGALAEGALLGSYAFTAYKSGARPPALRRVTFQGDDAAALKRARVVADAVHTARDLVNTPPNDLYPETFAERVAELAGRAQLDVQVLGPRELTRDGYGGLLAVGAGSARPPRLVRLTYRPRRAVTRIAL